MTIHNFEQHSQEWFDVKRGKFSCSTLSDLFMGKSTKGYNDAINKIVFERLTGETPESYVNADMKRGTELEPFAREKYQMETFNDVEQVGFIEYDDYFGFSPDGLVGDAGLIEIKCPKFTTLIDFALTRKIPKEYYYQMQGGLLVSKRQWCDFVMYHPKMNLIIEPVTPNTETQEQILDALAEAKAEVEKKIKEVEMRIRHYGSVDEKGKLILGNPDQFKSDIQKLKGKNRVYLVVDEDKPSRSSNQNSYYHGVVVKMLADEFGYTPSEMHEILKDEHAPKKVVKLGDKIKLIHTSTTALNTEEFEKYLDQIRIWALTNYNIKIPLPNEVDLDKE